MKATTLSINYVQHKNLDGLVNSLRYQVGNRKTLISTSRSFWPPKLPFAVISIDRQKTEYVVMLHKFF